MTKICFFPPYNFFPPWLLHSFCLKAALRRTHWNEANPSLPDTPLPSLFPLSRVFIVYIIANVKLTQLSTDLMTTSPRLPWEQSHSIVERAQTLGWKTWTWIFVHLLSKCNHGVSPLTSLGQKWPIRILSIWSWHLSVQSVTRWEVLLAPEKATDRRPPSKHPVSQVLPFFHHNDLFLIFSTTL